MGRPRKFTDAAKLQSSIDAYFDSAASDGRPLTITGLVLALGIDLSTFARYAKDPDFCGPIKKARLRIVRHIEENALLGAYNTTFCIFWLKNNAGWKDKQEQRHEGEITLRVKYVDTAGGNAPDD